MLCYTLEEFNPSCDGLNIAGGVRDIFVFDPSDFNFTKDVATKFLYSTMIPVTGTGVPALFDPKIYRIKFKRGGSAQLVQTQSIAENDGDVWDFTLSGNLVPVLTPEVSAFINSLQNAAVCCGLGFIIVLNNGEVLVIGEQVVGGLPIAEWDLRQSGTVINTGVAIGDMFGVALSIAGKYNRNAYHIDYSTIEDFIYTPTP